MLKSGSEEDFLTELFDEVDFGLFVVEAGLRASSPEPSFRFLLVNEVCHRLWGERRTKSVEKGLEERCRACLASGEALSYEEKFSYGKDGEVRWLTRLRPVKGPDG